MPTSFPVEIIRLFIEASRDWMPTLLQFALVSKDCMVESRKYTFERLELGQHGQNQRIKCDRIKEFHCLVTANVALGTHVRHLDLCMYPEEYNSIDPNLCAEELPAILLLLPALTSLKITCRERLGPESDWNAWPGPLKASIGRCCSSPTISTLHLITIRKFPREILTLPPNLKHLSLNQVVGVGESPDESERPATQAPRLQSLSIHGGWSVVANCVLANPAFIPCLTKLYWYIFDQEDMAVLGRVVREISGSLQELSVEFYRGCPPLGSTVTPLPQLKRLIISSELNINPLFRILTNHLNFYQELVQSQHELEDLLFTFKVSPQVNSRTQTIIPEIQIPRWDSLDEHICGLRRPPTRTVIHFTLRWPVPEGTYHAPDNLKVAFKNRLMQEAQNALHRSVEAGRVTVVLDESNESN
ncbi:hypothetical protein DFP72DRAFT_901427 [Ephemerocybe angulata]|uniref:Uncharacterized protein n=1 Tax=Ephemerocybe angulata TaxID=980116 RepID=A0A8H6M6B8_9AGAR|nr:hypothetical protein DFP72DRAFT_901427 [Tulosesus angulatus]